jgi:hypothetical protein
VLQYFVQVGGGATKSCQRFGAGDVPAGTADFGVAGDRATRGIRFEDQYDEGAAKRLAMFSAMTYCPLSSAVQQGSTLRHALQTTAKEVQNIAEQTPDDKLLKVIASGQCEICKHMGTGFYLIGTFGQQNALRGQSSQDNADNIYGVLGIYRDTRHMVFAFRGTQGPNAQNWKANVNIGTSKAKLGIAWNGEGLIFDFFFLNIAQVVPRTMRSEGFACTRVFKTRSI